MGDLQVNSKLAEVAAKIAQFNLNEKGIAALKSALESGNVEDLQKLCATLPKEVVSAGAEALKQEGNDYFKKGDYTNAIDKYTQALVHSDGDKSIWNNRALSNYKLRKFEEALRDAEECLRLDPNWAKAWYRKGMSLLQLKSAQEAEEALRKALSLEPTNSEIKLGLIEAEKAATFMRAMLNQQYDPATGQPVPSKPIVVDSVVNDTEEILSLKPTFKETMHFEHHRMESNWFKVSQQALGMRNLLVQFSELHTPAHCIQYIDKYQTVIRTLCRAAKQAVTSFSKKHSRNPIVLVLGSTAGVVPIEIHEAGAAKVYSVEPNTYMYHVSRATVMHHLAKKMKANLKERWEEQTKAEAESVLHEYYLNPGFELICQDYHLLDYTMLKDSPDIIVWSEIHGSGLSTRIVPAIQQVRRVCSSIGGNINDIQIVPMQLEVFATAFEFARGSTCISHYEKYLWSVHSEMASAATPLDPVSDSQKLFTLDFSPDAANTLKSTTKEVELRANRDGRLHGVVFHYVWHLNSSLSVSMEYGAEKKSNQMMQWLTPMTVTEDSFIPLTVQHDGVRVVATHGVGVDPAVRRWALQKWQFDFLLDTRRVAAYWEAFQGAVKYAKDESVTILTLCCGCSELAYYFATHSAVKTIYCVEGKQHLLDTHREAGEAALAQGGGAEKLKYICKDPRHIEIGEGKEIPEIPHLIIFELMDAIGIGEGVLIFVNRLKQMIGKDKFRKDPEYREKTGMERRVSFIPDALAIKGIILENRTSKLKGSDCDVDAPTLNIYRWQPSNSIVQLHDVEHKKLSKPFQIFTLDFYDEDLTDSQTKEDAPEIIEDGVASSCLVWFDAKLGVSGDGALTWGPDPVMRKYRCYTGQSLHFLQEVAVKKGKKLPMLFGIKGHLMESLIRTDLITGKKQDRFDSVDTADYDGVRMLPFPRFDPHWDTVYRRLEELGTSLAQRIQVSKEYEAVSQAITRIAVNPSAFNCDWRTAMNFAHSFF